jgi:RHS repeat-associated protein
LKHCRRWRQRRGQFCGKAAKEKENNKYHRDGLAQVVVEPYSIMYYDAMRGFSIEYNVLNLSAKIRKGGDSIEYIYLAKGEKLVKKKNGAVVNYYCGNMVYKADLTPEYVIHPEGLALYSGGAYGFQFNLTDHLGNVRTVLNASAAVQQANDYFPFGLTHATVANIAKNKYLYNGKELQNDVLGGIVFDQLDYGARFYDPVIGRWHAVDPLAEQNRGLSPFAYGSNNPINWIDPDGMLDDWYTINEKGMIIREEIRPNENYDVLMTKEAYNTGNINNGNSIQVNNRNILPTLAGEFNIKTVDKLAGTRTTYPTDPVTGKKTIEYVPKKIIDGHAAIISSKNEAKKIFEFAASNSNVEWSLSGYKNGKWVVGTTHENALAPTFSLLGEGYTFDNKTYDAHSHSGSSPRIDFNPSSADIYSARNLKSINPSAKNWLFMPKNPERKWMEIK